MRTKYPVMEKGKYKGLRIDQIPRRGLVWILGQEFPKEIMEAAKQRLSTMERTDIKIEITRHAYDSFSLRYLEVWQQFQLAQDSISKQRIGIGEFLSFYSNQSIKEGKDVSEPKDMGRKIIKYMGIKFVFSDDYKKLITVM